MKFLKTLRNGALAMSTASVAFMPTAFASGTGDVGDSVVDAILKVVYQIAFYIGLILLVWSVIMLIMALKNEDADSKSRAIMLIAVSIALIGVGTLLKPIVDAARAAKPVI